MVITAKEPLNNSLHAQSFRLARNLYPIRGTEGAILKVSPNWDRDMSIHRLFTFNTQRRVRASLEDPEGTA